MRKLVFAAALAAIAAPAPLHAQAVLQVPHADAPRPDGPRPEGGPRRMHRRLFISPSGEPFRGPDGFMAWFNQADADHDGAITPAEFEADAERAFRLFDTSGDGVVDGFELQAYERDVVPEITEFAIGGPMGGEGAGPRGGGWGRRGGGRRHGGGEPLDAPPGAGGADQIKGAGSTGAARFSLLNEPEPLTAADVNVDGKITHAEWMQAAGRRFARLDKDHDGKLTLGELNPPKAGKKGS